MSIVRMLTRVTAVAALRGQTWADKRVYDSDNTPLSQALMLDAGGKPYIVVYTDADNRNDVSGTDLAGAQRELSLVLEIGVATKVKGKTGNIELQTPLTDEGMEIALDMVEEQALAALFGSPQNDWADLMKRLVLRIVRLTGQRGASSDRDRRWAARQLGIVCDVVADLPPGVPVPHDHPISLFIETAQKHPEAGVDHIADICDALVKRDVAPQWEQVQALAGLSRLELRAIGLAPLASDLPVMATAHGDDLTDKQGEAPILRKISVDGMDMEDDLDLVGLVDPRSVETNVSFIKPLESDDTVEMDGNGG